MKYTIKIVEIREPEEGRGYNSSTLYEQSIEESHSDTELDVVERVIRAVNKIPTQK